MFFFLYYGHVRGRSTFNFQFVVVTSIVCRIFAGKSFLFRNPLLSVPSGRSKTRTNWTLVGRISEIVSPRRRGVVNRIDSSVRAVLPFGFYRSYVTCTVLRLHLRERHVLYICTRGVAGREKLRDFDACFRPGPHFVMSNGPPL